MRKLQPSKQVRHAQTLLGKCLAASVHTWIVPQAKLWAGPTPYQIWHRKVPDVSLSDLGVYSHIHTEREKWLNLSPHMEKCIFIGYPEGIKGWKFIIPKTQHTINLKVLTLTKNTSWQIISSRPTCPTRISTTTRGWRRQINNKQLENSPHQNTGSPWDFPKIEELNNRTDSPNGQEPVEESTG